MADLSITSITPDLMSKLGAEAFDLGLSQDDHNMNPGARAIKHWQAGWHAQRIVHARLINPAYPLPAQGDARRAES